MANVLTKPAPRSCFIRFNFVFETMFRSLNKSILSASRRTVIRRFSSAPPVIGVDTAPAISIKVTPIDIHEDLPGLLDLHALSIVYMACVYNHFVAPPSVHSFVSRRYSSQLQNTVWPEENGECSIQGFIILLPSVTSSVSFMYSIVTYLNSYLSCANVKYT